MEWNITMPRLKALTDDWQENPPLIDLVKGIATFLGIKPKPSQKKIEGEPKPPEWMLLPDVEE